MTSANIGAMKLNCVVMQDDIAKMNSHIGDARIGCELIDETLKKKQLSINYDKSKYILLGSKKYRKETMEAMAKEPMRMGNEVIGNAVKEKYLGDWIHELGCRESISTTIKERIQKLISKSEEIIQIAESPLMGALGDSTVAIRLFEAQIVPALLFNCESWVDISHTHLTELQNFQDKFLRKLLWMPPTTTKAILHWDGMMETMKWRIAKKKIMFIRKIALRNRNNICRRALIHEFIQGIKGLGAEGEELAKEAGLMDQRFHQDTKVNVKKATSLACRNECKREMENSRKVRDRLSDDRETSEYLKVLPLREARIWMRYRARAIKGVKDNCRASHDDLICNLCNEQETETQEHIETCSGYDRERRGLNLENMKDKLKFWLRVTAKLENRRN